MHLEEFAEGTSLLHVADPRIKLVAATAFAIAVATADAYRALLPALAIAAALGAIARLDLRLLASRLLVVNVFVLLLWLFLPFTFPGTPVWHLGPLAATREGIETSVLITLRTNAIVMATISLLGTTSIFNLVHALRHLHVPDKLVHTFFFCYRYIAVIHLEYTRLRHAMRVRGFRPRTSIHTYKSYAYLVGMLLIKSYERSVRIYQAMLCRGFRGEYPTFHHFHLHRRDLVGLAVMGLLIGVIAWL
ncbi:cobalt ECF transporter T component CbiQ [Candidatus Latescibacterota bacterium]